MENPIDCIAAEWVAREDRRDLSTSDKADLTQWLEQDPRHAGAYFRAKAIWHRFDRSAALATAELPSELQASPEPTSEITPYWTQAGTGRRAVLRAAVGLATSTALFWPPLAHDAPRLYRASGETPLTPRDCALPVTLDAGTSLLVEARHHQIAATVLDGRVWCDTGSLKFAADIYFNGVCARVQPGSSFMVASSAELATLLVTRGDLRVMSPWQTQPWGLRTGNLLTLSRKADGTFSGELQSLNDSEIYKRTGWKDGLVILRGDTLADAISEFNRYSRTKIIIESENLSRQKIVGIFKTSDVDAFVTAVCGLFGAQSVSDRRMIVIFPAGLK